ncbi:hypothetical protein ZHAS_00005936 [Anopheles sinensis]|uniref:Uncharacterized protein n=1 Tax=Anopheles sinensis TaxID=74873 RepID=A0A084VKN3_ANOSI|nr:hypothetical protein ZHAS_00005936 [Anopheles sinensis]
MTTQLRANRTREGEADVCITHEQRKHVEPLSQHAHKGRRHFVQANGKMQPAAGMESFPSENSKPTER